jgi:hypothetical protein
MADESARQGGQRGDGSRGAVIAQGETAEGEQPTDGAFDDPTVSAELRACHPGTIEARGNPVRIRDCPAAVSGNDRRQSVSTALGLSRLGRDGQ